MTTLVITDRRLSAPGVNSTGTLTFVLAGPALAVAGNDIDPVPKVATLSSGSLVDASGDPFTFWSTSNLGDGMYANVTVQVDGSPPYTVAYAFDADAPGATVDLADLVPLSPIPPGTPAFPYVPQSEVGQPNGVASLDGSGDVPTSQLGHADLAGTAAGLVGTEQARAEAAEGTLTTGLATETTNRTNADNTLATEIGTETTRATNAEATKVPLGGGTMTGALILSGDPTTALGAVTKQYADAISAGLSPKTSVYAVGLTAGGNVTLSGTQTLDGISIPANKRVLLTGQTNPAQNGLWLTASSAWSRPTDFASGSTQQGTYTMVEGGNTNEGAGWVMTGDSAVTVDTTAESWTQFSAPGNLSQYVPIVGMGAWAPQINVVDGVPIVTTDNRFAHNPTTDAWVYDPNQTQQVQPGWNPAYMGPGLTIYDVTEWSLHVATYLNNTLSGSGPPSGGTGNNGDFYVDTLNKVFYGPKASGAWPSGTSIIGPQGAAGVNGFSFNQTTLLTGSYTAAVSDLARFDTTGGAVSQPLPNRPANGAQYAIKQVNGSAGVTATCQGTDTIDKVGGGTSSTVTLTGETKIWQYASNGAGPGFWTTICDDLPIGQLDSRYLAAGTSLTITTSQTITPVAGTYQGMIRAGGGGGPGGSSPASSMNQNGGTGGAIGFDIITPPITLDGATPVTFNVGPGGGGGAGGASGGNNGISGSSGSNSSIVATGATSGAGTYTALGGKAGQRGTTGTTSNVAAQPGGNGTTGGSNGSGSSGSNGGAGVGTGILGGGPGGGSGSSSTTLGGGAGSPGSAANGPGAGGVQGASANANGVVPTAPATNDWGIGGAAGGPAAVGGTGAAGTAGGNGVIFWRRIA